MASPGLRERRESSIVRPSGIPLEDFRVTIRYRDEGGRNPYLSNPAVLVKSRAIPFE
jgi:hypothetical protein